MKVSVILPVYNRAATLPRCLAGVQAQTFTDWELVAADDCSTDDSVAVIEALRDPRIRVIRSERNGGPSAARNAAMRAAQGEVFALIDSDDEWLPTKLERQLAHLDATGCDLCGCEYWLVSNGEERRVRIPTPSSWPESLETKCELGNGTTLVVRRHVVESIGELDEGLRLYEDWDWVLRMVRRFKYSVVPEPLAKVYDGGPRNPYLFAEGSDRFLARHEAEFGPRGAQVRSLHYEYVAANAFAHRKHALGCQFVLKSFFASPGRRPAQLGALVLAPIDALFGTSLLQVAAGWQRGKSSSAQS